MHLGGGQFQLGEVGASGLHQSGADVAMTLLHHQDRRALSLALGALQLDQKNSK